jgi:hypothetical protein
MFSRKVFHEGKERILNLPARLILMVTIVVTAMDLIEFI